MRLEVASYLVSSLEWGERTALAGDRLSVSRAEIEALAADPEAFADVRLELVHPGERVRMVNVLDAVEPMCKVAGESSAYPGVLTPALTAGSGRTHRIEGVSVVACGEFPDPPTGVLSIKHGFVDMWGEAAPLCDASETADLVVVATPVAGLSNGDFDAAVRNAAHRVARRLAEATRDFRPHGVEVFELSPAPGLPRVVYVLQLQDQGPLIRPLLYGHHLGETFVPTLIHPNELLDGAVVSANHRCCLKLSTRLHARNPYLLDLYRRHGRDLCLAGVILKRGHYANHFLKQRAAEYAANLASLCGAQGAVITMEGTGNATIDYMQTLRALERRGIRAAGVFHELAGADGADSPLVDSVEEADALVSSGNAEEPIEIGAPDRVIGGDTFHYYTVATADPHRALSVSALECFCGLARMAQSGYTAVDF